MAWVWLHPEKINMGPGRITFPSGGTWDLYTSLQNLPIYKSTSNLILGTCLLTMSRAGILSQRVSPSFFFFFFCVVDDFRMQKCASHRSHWNNSCITMKHSTFFSTSKSPNCRLVMYWWTTYPLLYVIWKKQRKSSR